ncbi:ATP-dependent DNA helicase RecQ [Nitzschia inconspicua]|uniref:DNA 3'-5' helicase n=1 Tax=Nitzschia inconspicua TaxID=303405 RepID=A0A9K3Q5D9_9STRA|nr:ATP-dependent DNA helicase RecQ [Nitzschia inconspicua]
MTSTSRKSLSRLIRERDQKRERVLQLFEERKRINDEMSSLNSQLYQLDEDIERLEEEQNNQFNVQSFVKQESEIGDSESVSSHLTPTQQQVPSLTMNPDELLTGPATQDAAEDNLMPDDRELLTDPLTWTQPEVTTEQRPSSSSGSMSNGRAPLRPLDVRPVERKQLAKRRKDTAAAATAADTLDAYFVSNNNDNGDHDREGEDKMGNSSLVVGVAAAAAAAPAPPRRVTLVGSASPYFPSPTARNMPKCPYSTHDITQTLRQSFRLQSFRENQLEIIQTTLSGKDCFVLMKTGGGKSLLYQLPAVLESPKITLVVSPLLSLIQDQENQMNDFVPHSCVSFTSGMGAELHNANWSRVRDVTGGVMMILVTPEKVFKSNKLKSELQKLEEQNRLGRFVIDECHCACQWGHDFRPDYAKISVLRTHFPRVPILAVTATASDQVREDCAKIFQLSSDYAYFRSTANRPNLKYQVRPKESAADVIQDMVAFIRENHPRSAGIVYTYSRKDADTVARDLCSAGIVAESYHSDINAVQKRDIHESWMRNETQVVVATIAFGLGINKPDVRFVLHHTLSKTLEAYYQESGRAGRDGKPSDCVLYYSPKDVPRMIRMIDGESNADLFVTMVKYAQQFGDDKACRALILRNMGEPNQTLEGCQGLSDMVEKRDVTSHAATVLQLLQLHRNENMTMPMLVKCWRQNPKQAPECVRNNPPGKDLTPSDCERIIVGLLVNKLIEPNCRYTAYDTVVYLSCTPMAVSFIKSNKARMTLPLPKKIAKTGKMSSKSSEVKETDNAKLTKRKRSSSTAGREKKALPMKRSSKTHKSSVDANIEVIDLLDECDNDQAVVMDDGRSLPTRKANSRRPTETPLDYKSDSEDESDSEFEFEG